MSNEATINASLNILQPGGIGTWRSNITAFRANVLGTLGPTPGGIIATPNGVDVNFGSLVIPALCVIQNYDPVNYLEYGIYDPSTTTYYPLGEVQAGEGYVIRLSRRLTHSEGNVGTGTTGSSKTFRVKAPDGNVDCFVGAFSK
jgi:hypothetical protein